MDSRDDAATIVSLNSENSAIASHPIISKREESAIICAVEQNTGYHDILSAVHKLRNIIVDSDRYLHLFTTCSSTHTSNNDQILSFIYMLLKSIPFSELSDILNFVDFPYLAEIIECYIRGSTCRHMGHAKLKNGSKLQRYFHNLKSLCDDNGFQCRKRDLGRLFNELSSSIRNPKCEDIGFTQLTLNKLAIATWLRVQQCERSGDVRELIISMEQQTPGGVDKTILQIISESKLAVATELDGNHDIADQHLHNAVSIANIYSEPLTKSLLIHDKRYIHQLRFMRRKTEDDRLKVQSECDYGLSFFSSFETEFSTFMRRIMSLYKIHNLLKIGHNFEVDVSEEVSEDDIDHAASILASLEQCFQSGILLEQRRKMIFFVLKARMHEFQGDIKFAKSYLSAAYKLMPDGTFFEVEEKNLDDFRNRIVSS